MAVHKKYPALGRGLDALISTNSNHVTVAIRCSQMEQELITTDREELRMIVERELKKKSDQEEASV